MSEPASRLKFDSLAGAPCRQTCPTSPPSYSAPAIFGPEPKTARDRRRSSPGDALVLGPLSATVTALLGHARLISLHFDGSTDEIWSGIAHHGRPVQYAHVPTPLALWDVWTPIASPPVAFEPPSAGFALDWQMIAALRARNIGFATITHAAGISSTGDAELDIRLPFDEPYEVPVSTAAAIARARSNGGRIIAIGTTVVRALEHAAMRDGTVHAGRDIATERVGPGTRLRVVDAILTGVHERGTSHYELLRAFADETDAIGGGRRDRGARVSSARVWRLGPGDPSLVDCRIVDVRLEDSENPHSSIQQHSLNLQSASLPILNVEYRPCG